MSIEHRDMLKAIIKAEGCNQHTFAAKIGVPYREIDYSMRYNSCTDSVVEALNKFYGGDYSFLQRINGKSIRAQHYVRKTQI